MLYFLPLSFASILRVCKVAFARITTTAAILGDNVLLFIFSIVPRCSHDDSAGAPITSLLWRGVMQSLGHTLYLGARVDCESCAVPCCIIAQLFQCVYVPKVLMYVCTCPGEW